MADRPIIFSGPMVRALIEGRKTQTRRVMKPYDKIPGTFRSLYKPGDRLWVRETWGLGCRPCPVHGWVDGIEYKADCTDDDAPPLYAVIPDDVEVDDSPTGWRSPIYMPRWASRLTLIVEEVRVQRLQDISADDAIAEGCCFDRWITGEYPFFDNGVEADNRELVRMFRDRWNAIHGKTLWDQKPWDANPFVAALTFRVEPRNIDTL